MGYNFLKRNCCRALALHMQNLGSIPEKERERERERERESETERGEREKDCANIII
jgi:hypothetical protein